MCLCPNDVRQSDCSTTSVKTRETTAALRTYLILPVKYELQVSQHLVKCSETYEVYFLQTEMKFSDSGPRFKSWLTEKLVKLQGVKF